MNRIWSILFLLVPVIAIVTFVMAAFNVSPLSSAWLPENIGVAGVTIDHLFLMIHYLAAVILAGTGIFLAYCMFRFRADNKRRASYIHGNLKLEIIWSIIPAAILIFLAFYQMESWADNKIHRPQITTGDTTKNKPPHAMIVAKRFGWEVYYAGDDGLVGTPDDLFVENLLVVPTDEDIVLELHSRDVIHSFFVPVLRLKQDMVPGHTGYLWFNVRANAADRDYDIVCAELCGWGHYKMNGTLRVLNKNDFDQWIMDLKTSKTSVTMLND